MGVWGNSSDWAKFFILFALLVIVLVIFGFRLVGDFSYLLGMLSWLLLAMIFTVAISGIFRIRDPEDTTGELYRVGGISLSFIIAMVCAVIGAIYEATTGIVTITLGPFISFIAINSYFLSRMKSRSRIIGMGVGYILTLLVIILSIIVFFIWLGTLEGRLWFGLGDEINFFSLLTLLW